jgi:hypothetical protein
MNKIFNTIAAAAIAALTFSSCADVPEPYEIPSNGNDTTVVKNDSVYISESFASGFGSFTVKTITGTPWAIDYSTAKATGYDNSSKVTTASESYIVSSPIDLSKSNGAYLSFSYILRYSSTNASNKVLITDNYTGDPSTTTWTDITGTMTDGSDWTTFATYSQNIPTTFIGKSNVVVALSYKCNATSSSTIEVKNLLMKEGKVSNDTPTTPDDGVYASETFTSSFGSFTAKTVKGTPWIIDFSTAKATGYDSSTKTTTASEGYLVSSAMDLSASTGATVAFSYILRYYTTSGTVTSGVADKVLITDNYTGDPSTTTWTDMTGTLTEGSDWSTFASFSQSIPSAFIGKKNVVVALYYACAASSSTWEVKNLTIKEGTGTTGGETGGETSDNTITVAMSSFNLGNATDLNTQTLSDGTTLTFAQEDGTNGPKYYTSGTAARMYAKNSLTITSASKKITSVVITCTDPYNGTNYNGNDQLYGTAGSTTVTPTKTGTTTVSFTGFSDNALKIVNDYTATSAGTQLRILSLAITYAK